MLWEVAAARPFGAGGRSVKLRLVENRGRLQHAFSGLVRTPLWSWCGSPIRSGGKKPSDLEAKPKVGVFAFWVLNPVFPGPFERCEPA